MASPQVQTPATTATQANGEATQQQTPNTITDPNTPIQISGVEAKTIGELAKAQAAPKEYSDEFLGDQQGEMAEDNFYKQISSGLKEAGVTQDTYQKVMGGIVEFARNDDDQHNKELQEAIGAQSNEDVAKFVNQVNATFGNGATPFDASTLTPDQAKAFKNALQVTGQANNAQPPNEAVPAETIDEKYRVQHTDGKEYGIKGKLSIASVGAFKAIKVTNSQGRPAFLVDINSQAARIAKEATNELARLNQAEKPQEKRININDTLHVKE